MAVETLTADKAKAADKPTQSPWPPQTVGNPIAVGKLPCLRHKPRLSFGRGENDTGRVNVRNLNPVGDLAPTPERF